MMLEKVRRKNESRATAVSRAIEHIDSNPVPLTDSDLGALAKQVAKVLEIGSWEGNHTPKLNEAGDKALVDLTFQSGVDYLVYTATFHRTKGIWTLRGAHETRQRFSLSVKYTVQQ
jgi:hypothetical protein